MIEPIPVPTHCRLECLEDGEWRVWHHRIALLHPRRYVERLGAKGKVGRVILLDTGEIIQLVDESLL